MHDIPRKGTSVLVTGGSGFIGSHLIERLLSEGYIVTCLDNFCDYYDPEIKRDNVRPFLKHNDFRLIEADIRNSASLNRIFERFRIDKIVHLAAQPGVSLSLEKPHLYMDVNVKGTLNLLELSRKHKIDSLIFGSSSSVYGISTETPFNETGELNPISPYGVSKRCGELLCYTYNYLYGIKVTILRFFTVYGPRQRPDMAIHKFTRFIDEEKLVYLFGSGTSRRDYTYVSDAIEGVMLALNKGFKFQIFNIGNSQPITLSELVHVIEKNLQKKARIKYLPERAGDLPVTFADIDRARTLLGYNPKVTIEDGIRRYVEWYKHESVHS